MGYSDESKELDYAWASVSYPLDAIAENYLKLVERIKILEGEEIELP